MRRSGERAGVAERLADDAAAYFESGEFERALSSAERACELLPQFVPALHWRAAALAEMGRMEDARVAYEQALAAGPEDVDLLLGTADFYVNRLQEPETHRERLERGLELARRARRLARRRYDPDFAAELILLEGMALSQLGYAAEALPCLEEAIKERPDDLDALLERGFALYELCRFDDAHAQLLEVLRKWPQESWAHHMLGLIAERQGDAKEAARRFERARKLAPDEFPSGVELACDSFDAAVEDALLSLPEQVRNYLSNVAITVEDLPSEDDLLTSDPPLSPSILGIFRGSPLGQKASMDPWSHLPSSIVLYQKNLERFARNRQELVEQIGITLIHEVGHFLGLDEEHLWQLGVE